MQDYRAYIVGSNGHVWSLICGAMILPKHLSKPSNLRSVTTSSYGNLIDRSGRSRHRIGEIASHLPFVRLDFKLGLKPELEVAACGATVLLPEFLSAH